MEGKRIWNQYKFIELAGEINSSMPSYVVNKVSDSLNNICKPINKSNILILGISYKKNIDDARESPSLEIINLLLKKGALLTLTILILMNSQNLENIIFR